MRNAVGAGTPANRRQTASAPRASKAQNTIEAISMKSECWGVR
jgi:hypothetical protein